MRAVHCYQRAGQFGATITMSFSGPASAIVELYPKEEWVSDQEKYPS